MVECESPRQRAHEMLETEAVCDDGFAAHGKRAITITNGPNVEPTLLAPVFDDGHRQEAVDGLRGRFHAKGR